MSRPFTTLSVIIVVLLALAHAFWLVLALDISIDDFLLPKWMVGGIFVLLAMAGFGALVEAWRAMRRRRADARAQAKAPAKDTAKEAVSRDAQPRAMTFTVHQGKRYKARIALGFFEQVASNGMIAEKFGEVGFADVSVTGSGGEREAIGRWTGADTSAQLPPQVVAAVEIVEPPLMASLTKAAATLAQRSPRR